uniref:Glycosyltransferase 2-like domain-containing protein n=1 Tax=uncultured Alphaproteobacteria bacterium TaxID=91750 RepID=A0A6G8F3A3_9PROT|nr:hypothetical protein PlAlph_6060 [uncultured Alphaproteobacteria bacterium]
MKIDLVYLWCDGNDAAWREKKLFWQKKYGNLDVNAVDDCRFVQHDELKFSLRSVEMYMPWINHIFIVTDGQVPDWLDTENPKISIVDHKEIMPSEALPTFNSNAIETCLHNIPGLSEHFLFANDDTFVARPLKPDFFFAEDGRPYVFLQPFNASHPCLYTRMIHYAQAAVKAKFGKDYPFSPHHNIDAYRVSDIKKCIETFSVDFGRTVRQRFREENTIQRSIYGYFALATNAGIMVKNSMIDRRLPKHQRRRMKKKRENYKISHVCTSPNNIYSIINEFNPGLFCLNDSENLLTEERCKIKWNLAQIFPYPSVFEKKKECQWSYLVSIIIPVCNAAGYLRRCLDSIINQTLQNIEIICVNDGSSDCSMEILKNYAERDKRIKIISFEKIGPGGCRNAGIDAAQGEYICFVDADDYIEATACQKAYAKIKESKAPVLSFNVLEIMAHGVKKGVFFGGNVEKDISWKSIQADFFNNRFACWHLLINHDYLNYHHFYFSADRYYGEELLFMLPLVLSAPKIKLLPDFLYRYCRNNTSLIARDMTARLQLLKTISELRHFLSSKKEYSVLLSGFDEWCCRFAIYAYNDLSEDIIQRHVLCKGLQRLFSDKVYKRFKKQAADVSSVKIFGLPLVKATQFDNVRRFLFCGLPIVSIRSKK